MGHPPGRLFDHGERVAGRCFFSARPAPALFWHQMAFTGTRATKREASAHLIAAGGGIKDICRETGVSIRTAHRWVASDDFQQRVESIRSGLFLAVAERLMSLGGQAAATLAELVANGTPKIKLDAAKFIVQTLMHLRETIEFDERLDVIERKINEATTKKEFGQAGNTGFDSAGQRRLPLVRDLPGNQAGGGFGGNAPGHDGTNGME